VAGLADVRPVLAGAGAEVLLRAAHQRCDVFDCVRGCGCAGGEGAHVRAPYKVIGDRSAGAEKGATNGQTSGYAQGENREFHFFSPRFWLFAPRFGVGRNLRLFFLPCKYLCEEIRPRGRYFLRQNEER
jgi:hypothetical protein